MFRTILLWSLILNVSVNLEIYLTESDVQFRFYFIIGLCGGFDSYLSICMYDA